MKRLKGIIRQWRRNIALLLYPVNVVELTRRQVGSITSLDVTYTNDPEYLRKIEARCLELRQDEVLQLIIEKLMAVQINFIAKRAETMELVTFGRGSINGSSLVMEEIERLASNHEDRLLKPDGYNQFDVI